MANRNGYNNPTMPDAGVVGENALDETDVDSVRALIDARTRLSDPTRRFSSADAELVISALGLDELELAATIAAEQERRLSRVRMVGNRYGSKRGGLVGG